MRYNLVEDIDYLEWLASWNFETLGPIYDDDIQYRVDLTSKDIENCLKISYLHSNISRLDTNGDKYFEDLTIPFQNITYFLKLKNKFYILETMWGQGAATTLDIEKNPSKFKDYYAFNLDTKTWEKI